MSDSRALFLRSSAAFAFISEYILYIVVWNLSLRYPKLTAKSLFLSSNMLELVI